MNCKYSHHDEDMADKCSECGTELKCGPMMHACPECDDFYFKHCNRCGAKRIYCSC